MSALTNKHANFFYLATFQGYGFRKSGNVEITSNYYKLIKQAFGVTA